MGERGRVIEWHGTSGRWCRSFGQQQPCCLSDPGMVDRGQRVCVYVCASVCVCMRVCESHHSLPV